MVRPLRLLHVHNNYQTDQPSGETQRVLQEIDILRRGGHTVTLLTIENDEIAGWRPSRRALLPFRSVWSTSSYGVVRRAIRRTGADLVHVHNTLPLASPSVFWAAHRSGLPVVHTLANYRLMCSSASFLRDGRPCEDCMGRTIGWPGVLHACYRDSRAATATVALTIFAHRRLGTYLRAIDVMLVGSQFARRKHVEGGFPAGQIVVKPNTAPDPGIVRKGSGSHFLFAGRLGPEKGLNLLLQAWELAKPRGPRELRIAGDGPMRGALENYAIRQRLQGVRFLGRLSREGIYREMLDARALVSPSVAYEVSPVSIVEAFAAGVPVVVPRGGAQAEIVTPEETGLHFAGGEAGSLAAALDRLDEDLLAETLGRRARGAYENHHSEDSVLAALEHGYQLALSRHHESQAGLMA